VSGFGFVSRKKDVHNRIVGDNIYWSMTYRIQFSEIDLDVLPASSFMFNTSVLTCTAGCHG
jgi:hypothetical protein